MRRVVVLVLFVLGSAACGAVVRWEKSGASDAARQRDETECAARASRESTVPSAQTVGTSSGTPADPQSVRVQPYDSAVFDECMKTRGYERVPPHPAG